jgi:hypothetical protein
VTGPFGAVLPLLLGVSSGYGGGQSPARPLPTLYYRYSET